MPNYFLKLLAVCFLPVVVFALDANHSFNDLKITQVWSAKVVSFANATLWQYNTSKDTLLNGFQIQEVTFPINFFDDIGKKRSTEVIRKKPAYGCRANWGYLVINDSLYFSVPCGWRMGDNSLIILFRSAEGWVEKTFFIEPELYEKQEIHCIDVTKNRGYQKYFRNVGN